MILFYIDVDGCLRDLVGAADRLYKEKFPNDEPVKIDTYMMSLRYPMWGEDTWDIIFRQYVDRVFNLDAEAHEGAIEAINWLHSQDDVIVKLLSKQDKWRQEATDTWLDRVEIDPTIERLYVIDISKGEYILGDDNVLTTVLIDDSPNEIESAEDIVDYPIIVIRDWNKTFREAWRGTQLLDVTEKALKSLLEFIQADLSLHGDQLDES